MRPLLAILATFSALAFAQQMAQAGVEGGRLTAAGRTAYDDEPPRRVGDGAIGAQDLRVHPEIGKALKTREAVLIDELEQMTRKSIIIQSDPTLHWEQYDIY